jgi:hypothetical protein
MPKDGKLLAIGHSMGGILLYSMLSRSGKFTAFDSVDLPFFFYLLSSYFLFSTNIRYCLNYNPNHFLIVSKGVGFGFGNFHSRLILYNYNDGHLWQIHYLCSIVGLTKYTIIHSVIRCQDNFGSTIYTWWGKWQLTTLSLKTINSVFRFDVVSSDITKAFLHNVGLATPHNILYNHANDKQLKFKSFLMI